MKIFFWAQIAGCASDRRHTQRVTSFPMGDLSPSRTGLKTAERKQDAPVNCTFIYKQNVTIKATLYI